MRRNILFYITILSFIFTSCAKEGIPGEFDREKPALTEATTKIIDTLPRITVTIAHAHWEPSCFYLDFLKIFINFQPDRMPTSLLSSSLTERMVIHCTIYKNDQEAGYVEITWPYRNLGTFSTSTSNEIMFFYGGGITNSWFPENDPDPSATYKIAITDISSDNNRYDYFPTSKILIENDGGSVH